MTFFVFLFFSIFSYHPENALFWGGEMGLELKKTWHRAARWDCYCSYHYSYGWWLFFQQKKKKIRGFFAFGGSLERQTFLERWDLQKEWRPSESEREGKGSSIKEAERDEGVIPKYDIIDSLFFFIISQLHFFFFFFVISSYCSFGLDAGSWSSIYLRLKSELSGGFDTVGSCFMHETPFVCHLVFIEYFDGSFGHC